MKSVRKRRLKGKTDYKNRFGLLKSEKIRLVVRKTNKHIIAQVVETNASQDKILCGINSKTLLEKGWSKEKSGSLKSLGASYLVGLIIGKLAKEKKIKEAIFDIGMHRNIQGSRMYGVLKGAIEAGLKIKHDPAALPSDEDLKRNNRIGAIVNKMKEKLKNGE